MRRLRQLGGRLSEPRVPAVFLLLSLVLMTAGWGYSWFISAADEPLIAPPGYVYVTVPYSVPRPGAEEGWRCQNVGSSNSPYYLQDPVCLVPDTTVSAEATPVDSVGRNTDRLAATMTVVTGVAALIASLGAIGIRVSRNDAVAPTEQREA